MLYKERGPHAVLQQQLGQQRLLRGLPCSSAAAAAGSELQQDLEVYLGAVMGEVRRSMCGSSSDLGRFVVVLRLGNDSSSSRGGCGSGSGGSSSKGAPDAEVGLIIAASAGSKPVAEEAVMQLLGHIEGVLQGSR